MKYSIKIKQFLFVGLAIVFILVMGIIYMVSASSTYESSNIVEQDGDYLEKSMEEDDVGLVEEESNPIVYICGAVINADVYELQKGARVSDAIAAAGGFSDTAAKDSLNLAEPIVDGQKITVYTKKQWKEMNEMVNESTTQSRININSATIEELMTLPGIGQSKAESIVAYRTEQGGFQVIEDIMNIPGLKEGVFSQLSEWITVQ